MQEINEFLNSLHIYRIKVPTPYPVGPTNSYLIKKKPYTLIDPGCETDEAKEVLLAGLEREGVKPEEIERIVLTHYHNDHCGLAYWLHGINGAEIFVHQNEFRKLQPDYDYYGERMTFLQEAGLSQEELYEIFEDKDPVPDPILPEKGVTLVNGGEVWDYEDRQIKIIHVPGHSNGHIGLFDEDNQVYFSGDFILKNITPNPLMEPKEQGSPERLPVLSQYINCVELFAELPIRVVLPGHGGLIKGNAEITANLVRHHLKRLEHYQSLIRGREISAHQLMKVIYPDSKGYGIFLAISEILAHLDLLTTDGLLTVSKRDGICYYSLKNP